MKFILGKKQNMTQVFNENGKVIPATIVNAGPISAVQMKTKDKDGYEAVVFGFGQKKEKNVNKAQRNFGNFSHLKEYRPKEGDVGAELGKILDVSIFNEGDVVEVSGTSKGKGFQGVVKRHGFKGGQRTHGQRHSEREPGTIGGGLRTRVPKGMRMAGRMGGDRVTVRNLKIIKIDKDKNQILISGAIPGRRGTLLEIRG
ncbi:MAG: 50S ribosomal protein L3 [Patescibacteria group bacterium]